MSANAAMGTIPRGAAHQESRGRQLSHPCGSHVSTTHLRREVQEYYRGGATVGPGHTVVDVGANIGAFALSVAERCQGMSRLVCIEPSASSYAALATNFRQNPLLASTTHTLLQVGLTSREKAGRETTFYNCRRFPTNSTLDLATKRRELEIFFEDRGRRLRVLLGPAGHLLERLLSTWSKTTFAWWAWRFIMGLEEIQIRTLTLKDVLKSAGIDRVDLLKIDVEGHEVDVLLGLDSDTWPCIQQVVVETQKLGGRYDKILSLLRSRHLTVIRITLQQASDNGLQSLIVSAHRPKQLSQ